MILAYCSDKLTDIPPSHGAGSAYSPNLLAAILACFDGEEMTGRSPISLSG